MLSLSYKKFKDITKFDLLVFFEQANDFFSNQYPKLLAFYSGNVEEIDTKSIEDLKQLEQQSKFIDSLFLTYKPRFNNSDFFLIQSLHEEIKTKISTTKNISKWTRSKRKTLGASNQTSVTLTTGKNQAVEDLIIDSVGQITEGEVVDNLISMKLTESDWSIVDGNKEVKILTNKISNNNEITTFFDEPTGEKIFGKDLKTNFSIVSDDLQELPHTDTLQQTIKTLLSLKKDNLFYNKSLGITDVSVIGSNLNMIQHKTLISELSEVFGSDDLFSSIAIQDLNYFDGNLFITCIISVKMSKEIKVSQQIL